MFCAFAVLLCCVSLAFYFYTTNTGIVRFTLLFFVVFCTSYVQFLMLLSSVHILCVYLVVCSWCAGAVFVAILLRFVVLIVVISCYEQATLCVCGLLLFLSAFCCCFALFSCVYFLLCFACVFLLCR